MSYGKDIIIFHKIKKKNIQIVLRRKKKGLYVLFRPIGRKKEKAFKIILNIVV